jgi:hypothetical protein
VLDKNGKRLPSEHNMFVDENLIAEIWPIMKLAMAASIKSLLLILGYDKTVKRQFALSLNKYFKHSAPTNANNSVCSSTHDI